MIYLASPYSHENYAVMERRFELTCAVVAAMVKRTFIIYSPIVHFHPVAERHDLPRDFAFWERLNLGMLEKADQLFVLELDGWKTSKGVTAEIEAAKSLMLPILEVDPTAWGVPSS